MSGILRSFEKFVCPGFLQLLACQSCFGKYVGKLTKHILHYNTALLHCAKHIVIFVVVIFFVQGRKIVNCEFILRRNLLFIEIKSLLLKPDNSYHFCVECSPQSNSPRSETQ